MEKLWTKGKGKSDVDIFVVCHLFTSVAALSG